MRFISEFLFFYFGFKCLWFREEGPGGTVASHGEERGREKQPEKEVRRGTWAPPLGGSFLN